MSSKNNVNKDFYTMAGRDRPNEDLIVPKLPRDEGRGPRGVGSRRNFIPGAAPVGESPGKGRPKSHTSGDARRRTSTTKTAKRGTPRAAATAKRRVAPPRRSRRRAA